MTTATLQSKAPTFNPLAPSTVGATPSLAERTESGPEEQAKEMEARVHGLVEASAAAAARGDVVMALERAKEAGRKERQLVKHKEANGMGDAVQLELTYCVAFNLANAVSFRSWLAISTITHCLCSIT